MNVRKAVIPTAGRGTRFLPVTKAQPKGMLPLVDKPAIQYVVEEIVEAGVRDILMVTDMAKRALEDHFDRSMELELALLEKGDHAMLEQLLKISEMADFFYVRQKQPLGLGHAILCAEKHVGHEPFAIALPDDITPQDNHLMRDLIGVYQRYGRSVIAVREVPMEETQHLGVIQPEPVEDNLVRIVDFVEKPAPGTAPSNLAAIGRYVLTPEIFEELHDTEPGAGGEIQLTDAIRSLARRQTVYAYIYDGPRYDIGRKLGYIQAMVEMAIIREDIGAQFREFLADLARRNKLV